MKVNVSVIEPPAPARTYDVTLTGLSEVQAAGLRAVSRSIGGDCQSRQVFDAIEQQLAEADVPNGYDLKLSPGSSIFFKSEPRSSLSTDNSTPSLP